MSLREPATWAIAALVLTLLLGLLAVVLLFRRVVRKGAKRPRDSEGAGQDLPERVTTMRVVE